jgi:hypothetical protein
MAQGRSPLMPSDAARMERAAALVDGSNELWERAAPRRLPQLVRGTREPRVASRRRQPAVFRRRGAVCPALLLVVPCGRSQRRGGDDRYVIVDAPDNERYGGRAPVNAAGGATVKAMVLLTPDEVEGDAKRSVEHRPPGADERSGRTTRAVLARTGRRARSSDATPERPDLRWTSKRRSDNTSLLTPECPQALGSCSGGQVANPRWETRLHPSAANLSARPVPHVPGRRTERSGLAVGDFLVPGWRALR